MIYSCSEVYSKQEEKMSNKKLPLATLEVLRKKAVEAVLKEGLTRQQAAKIFGFSRTSMTKYVRDYEKRGEASFQYKVRGVKPLTRRYLSEEQSQHLINFLLQHTPDELNLDWTLWNSKAIRALIQERFGILYSERGIRNLVSTLGFSSQKPINLKTAVKI
jgi:transposase